jgi:putative membrane protein
MANYHRRAFSIVERIMEVRQFKRGLVLAGLMGVTAPAWAVSLSSIESAPTVPETNRVPVQFDAVELTGTAGSTSLVPLMAADMQARPVAVDMPANGGAPVGKPIDDIQFVKQATESGRKEISSAQEALPQLKDPRLKHIAEMLVADHGNANQRLSQVAETKGWPLPGPHASDVAPPAGTASADFDATWTAEMIAGHERSVALYRAQATGGEDKDLRKYAKDTLPTIEKHLAELRRLQK